MPDVFHHYIPKFEYILVDLNRYTQEDLVRFNDTLSLVMIIDKLKKTDGKSLLSKIPLGYLQKIALKIPAELTKLLVDVVTVLLNRDEYPKEEIQTITGYFTDKEDQSMFEGFVEAMVEHGRINRAEGREEGRKEGRGEGREEGRKEGRNAVLELVKQGYTAEQIEAKLASDTAGTKTAGAIHV
jgi:hypothetical protein